MRVLTFLSTTKDVIASFKACWKAAGAASPCTQLGSNLSLAKDCIAQLRSGPNLLLSASVLAGIEPFKGLKASWPSLLPQTFSHSIHSCLWGAPFAKVNPSVTKIKASSVPGKLTHPKSSLSFSLT